MMRIIKMEVMILVVRDVWLFILVVGFEEKKILNVISKLKLLIFV